MGPAGNDLRNALKPQMQQAASMPSINGKMNLMPNTSSVANGGISAPMIAAGLGAVGKMQDKNRAMMAQGVNASPQGIYPQKNPNLQVMRSQ